MAATLRSNQIDTADFSTRAKWRLNEAKPTLQIQVVSQSGVCLNTHCPRPIYLVHQEASGYSEIEGVNRTYHRNPNKMLA